MLSLAHWHSLGDLLVIAREREVGARLEYFGQLRVPGMGGKWKRSDDSLKQHVPPAQPTLGPSYRTTPGGSLAPGGSAGQLAGGTHREVEVQLLLGSLQTELAAP